MTTADHQHEPRDEHTATGGSGAAPQETAAPAPGGAGSTDSAGAQQAAASAPGSAPGSADGGEDVAQEMTDDLARAQRDLSELTGDLQRLQAEYLNYKRRVDRDRELVKENARFAVLSGLLPVLDDIDRAREHGELEGGFKAVADSLERVVAGMGLEKFGAAGDPFDPNLHEALMHAHSAEVTTTTCQHIVQAGYRIGDRVVRAARVTVVDPEPGSEAAPDSATGSDTGSDTGGDQPLDGASSTEPPASGATAQ